MEAGRLSNRPVILDNNILSWTGRDTRTKVLEKMRPGDLHTHFYNDRHVEILDRRTRRRSNPSCTRPASAASSSISGHGGGSFLWTVADRAMSLGFPPDIISTDIHASSILTTQSDMPNCMSKMLTLGMELKEIIYRSTVTPARAVNRFPGRSARSARARRPTSRFCELEEGVFAYHDAWEKKRLGTRRIVNVLTVRAGEIVYDRDGRAFADWEPRQQRADSMMGRLNNASSLRSQPRLPRADWQPSGVVAPADPIYDLLLKNGIVIDPSSGRNGRFDVAIVGERIARIAANLAGAPGQNDGRCQRLLRHARPDRPHAYVNAQGCLPPGRSPHRLAQRQPRSQHTPPWRDDRRRRRQHRLEELRVVQASW